MKWGVVFDMDGVLVNTEHVWDDVRQTLVADWGGRYSPDDQQAMMGMSSTEWSRYMHDELGVSQTPEVINAAVVARMLERYETELPIVTGAVEAVDELVSAGFPLALASSSNRELIDAVLRAAGLAGAFPVTVSSEEVPRGKPSPDVYLEAAERLGIEPERCVAVEDSANGIRAAHAAAMHVIAYPNAHFPPAADALALAEATITRLSELPDAVRAIAGGS